MLQFATQALFLNVSGTLPDPSVLSLGGKLQSLRPQPLMASVLHGLSELSMVDSRYVFQALGLSYTCSQEPVSRHLSKEVPTG